MVSSKATTVKQYLASLPADRRKSVEAVRKVVKKALPKGFEEGMQYGMIGWYVPLKRYPDTYNGQPLGIVALASQKQYISLYLMGVYADPKVQKAFEKKWKASGKKLNMGKSCVRFKNVDELAMDAIVDAVGAMGVERYIAIQEKLRSKKPAKKKPAKKAAPKRKSPATRKSPAKGKSPKRKR